MYKLALSVVILATMAWAQDNSSGCGPDQSKFQVKRDSHSHPTGVAETGKALVYVFGDSELDNTPCALEAWIQESASMAIGSEPMDSSPTCIFRSLPASTACAQASSLLLSRAGIIPPRPLLSQRKKARCITSEHNRLRHR